jgi:hypothetical protein
MQVQGNTFSPSAQVDDKQLQSHVVLLNHVHGLAGPSRASLLSIHGNLNAGLSDQVQRVMHQAFAAQRNQALNQSGSSNNARLVALNKLEQRGFQPAEGGLKIRITGKGLGGAGDDDVEGSSRGESSRGGGVSLENNISLSECLKRFEFFANEEMSHKANVTNLADALYKANQAVTAARRVSSSRADLLGAEEGRDCLSKELEYYQGQLRSAKQHKAFYASLIRFKENERKGKK